MKISEAFNKFGISFEIFPPKTEAGQITLYSELDQLSAFKPKFISVTYGAGGSTRDKTLELSLEIRKRFTIDPLVHFTCVGSSRDDVKEYLEKIKSFGLNNILALRGDPPAGVTDFKPAADGFEYASELIKFIRSINGFSIAVAGYPEKHPKASSLSEDIIHLKEKVDAGAELILTQLFFGNSDFLKFRDLAAAEGITIPIIPGIMPIVNKAQIEKMAQISGAKVPQALAEKLSSTENPDTVTEIGIEFASNQCEELIKEGVGGFHFYPLNKASSVRQVIKNSGIESLCK